MYTGVGTLRHSVHRFVPLDVGLTTKVRSLDSTVNTVDVCNEVKKVGSEW